MESWKSCWESCGLKLHLQLENGCPSGMFFVQETSGLWSGFWLVISGDVCGLKEDLHSGFPFAVVGWKMCTCDLELKSPEAAGRVFPGPWVWACSTQGTGTRKAEARVSRTLSWPTWKAVEKTSRARLVSLTFLSLKAAFFKAVPSELETSPHPHFFLYPQFLH